MPKVLLELLKLYAMYVPHITEEIYQWYFKDFEKAVSIHSMLWNMKSDTKDEDILYFGENIKKLIGEVRKYKSERNLSLKVKLDCLKLNIPENQGEHLQKTLKDIKACTWAEEIKIRFSDELDIEIQ